MNTTDRVFYPNIITGEQSLVLLGESGSGKSEIALNLAQLLAGKGWAVDLFDLDQTKPLFRSRDAADRMAAAGVRLFYEEQLLDTPVVTGGVRESLINSGVCTILDVGGFDIGSRMIGRFAKILRQDGTKVIYIVNPYRPWTKDSQSLARTMSDISRATGLADFHFIANPHLGHKTTGGEFLAGLAMAEERLPEGKALEGACLSREIYKEVRGKTDLPLLPMELNLRYEWTSEDYIWEK